MEWGHCIFDTICDCSLERIILISSFISLFGDCGINVILTPGRGGKEKQEKGRELEENTGNFI